MSETPPEHPNRDPEPTGTPMPASGNDGAADASPPGAAQGGAQGQEGVAHGADTSASAAQGAAAAGEGSATAAADTSAAAPASRAEYDLEELIRLYDEHGLDSIDSDRLARTTPYTVGRFLGRLEVDERRSLLRKMRIEDAADILAEMDSDDAAEVLQAMRHGRAAQVLEYLDPDDSADIIADMETADQDRLLGQITPETAAIVRDLISYPPDTAGGIMTPHVAKIPMGLTVLQAVRHLQRLNNEFEHIYYVYVVDEDDKLLGTVSMRDLVMARPEEKIKDIMRHDLRGVIPVDTDQEVVAREMAKQNLHALPVVDADGRLVGMVTDDDVIDVINQEATEDFHKLHGAGADETLEDPIGESVRRRSPWLMINMVSAFMAGAVISLFEKEIGELTILAAFMPIVASLGGNAGGQTLAIVIRSMALGRLEGSSSRHVCRREAMKAMGSSLVIGLLAAVVASLYTGRMLIGCVILVSMMISMTYAGLAGAFIPLGLRRLKLDPAQSSQMFLTASTDIVSFGVFLGLSSWVLL